MSWLRLAVVPTIEAPLNGNTALHLSGNLLTWRRTVTAHQVRTGSACLTSPLFLLSELRDH